MTEHHKRILDVLYTPQGLDQINEVGKSSMDLTDAAKISLFMACSTTKTKFYVLSGN